MFTPVDKVQKRTSHRPADRTHTPSTSRATAGFVAISCLVALAALACSPGVAQVSDNHDVRVCVQPFSSIAVRGEQLPLVMSGDGEGVEAVSDAAGLGLYWMTNQENQKITVVSTLDSPRYDLRVEAVNVEGGVPTGAVLLDTTTKDLVVGLSRGTGSCNLRFTASANRLPEPDVDVHVVSYTITDGA